MTVDNFEALLARLLERRPFSVFTVELRTGQRFEIDHPLSVVARDGVAIHLAPGGIPVWFDHESVNAIYEATAAESPAA